AKSVKTDAGVIAGEYSAQVDENGKVFNEVKSQNQTNLSISKLGALSLMTWRQENNDMNKRLGEIRDSQGEQGIWARMSRGEAKYSATGVKNQYNYYQLGYDHKIADDWILGGAFTYTDGENNLVGGSGTNKNTGFAVYGSNLRDDGSFIDLIAKYAHMKNDFDTIGGVGIGEYSTNGYALSAEYGKRFQQDGFWIEPQAELTYGKVSSADFTTSEGAKVHQDSLDSLVGRLGFSLGKDVKAGNVYVRASYLYDFKGDVAMRMSNGVASATYDQDLGGSWWEFGVGTNLNFGKDMHFYFDVERTEGGKVDTPWQWNAGVRLSF
ncbi:MAG: autotransporter outer membrane beta-barrel domain-containing protein, partial [Dialister sp.]|nr:autotransporter outer membrane beta-barrel domain-containing protein [Dialister sp.]MDY6116081.1 autotransporter outer membrane beta-barrel domain-containing protein [Dialister sp.]